MGNQALQTLHLALTDFDYRGGLRQPPLLLAGGLDAWVDLYGPASLALTTAEESKEALSKSILFRRSREVTRTPTPHLLERRALPYPISEHRNAQQPLAMPAEPTKITIEEEKKRLESLQGESRPLSVSVSAGAEDGKQRRQGMSTVATSTRYPRTVEEYVREKAGGFFFFKKKKHGVMRVILIVSPVSKSSRSSYPRKHGSCPLSFFAQAYHHRPSIPCFHRCEKPRV